VVSNIKEQYAFKTTYDIKLDLKEIKNYKALFEQHHAPSKSKAAVVADVITSIPNTNSNGMGFTAKTLQNSYQTMKTVPIDYEHDQSFILGNVIEPFLVEENSYTILRVAGVMWKKPLRYLGIDDLTQPKWSMECYYNDYAFYTQSKGIIEKEQAPIEWVEKLEYWDYGEPVIDQENGERVILLLGGSDGVVEFSGLAVTWNPADKTTQTLYQAASNKNKKGSEFKLDEKELQKKIDEAIASVKADYDKKLEEFKASIVEKDNLIKDYEEKLKAAEANVLAEKERADKAESELQKIAIAKLVDDRKQILASKNYTEFDEEDEKFLAEASEEDFNAFVKRIEKIANATVSKVKTEFEAKAFEFGLNKEVIASLKLADDENNDQSTNDKIDIGYFL